MEVDLYFKVRYELLFATLHFKHQSRFNYKSSKHIDAKLLMTMCRLSARRLSLKIIPRSFQNQGPYYIMLRSWSKTFELVTSRVLTFSLDSRPIYRLDSSCSKVKRKKLFLFCKGEEDAISQPIILSVILHNEIWLLRLTFEPDESSDSRLDSSLYSPI